MKRQKADVSNLLVFKSSIIYTVVLCCYLQEITRYFTGIVVNQLHINKPCQMITCSIIVQLQQLSEMCPTRVLPG